MLEFKPREKEDRKIKIYLGGKKYKIIKMLDRTIENQRKIYQIYSQLESIDQTNVDQMSGFLNEVIGLLFPTMTLDDFKNYSEDDLLDLMNTVKDRVISQDKRTLSEKKKESDEPLQT